MRRRRNRGARSHQRNLMWFFCDVSTDIARMRSPTRVSSYGFPQREECARDRRAWQGGLRCLSPCCDLMCSASAYPQLLTRRDPSTPTHHKRRGRGDRQARGSALAQRDTAAPACLGRHRAPQPPTTDRAHALHTHAYTHDTGTHRRHHRTSRFTVHPSRTLLPWLQTTKDLRACTVVRTRYARQRTDTRTEDRTTATCAREHDTNECHRTLGRSMCTSEERDRRTNVATRARCADKLLRRALFSRGAPSPAR